MRALLWTVISSSLLKRTLEMRDHAQSPLEPDLIDCISTACIACID